MRENRFKHIFLALALVALFPATCNQGTTLHTFSRLIIPEDVTFYIKTANIFDEMFTSPCEEIILLFRDGRVVVSTNNLDATVFFPYVYLDNVGRDVKDLTHVIHSHPVGGAWFSLADRNLYKSLKLQGFTGAFLVYYVPTKAIIDIEEKK